MTTLELVLALGAVDRTERDAAAAAVADLGSGALPALIGQLQDSVSPVSESVLLAVLRRIGSKAFESVLCALQASAPGKAPQRMLRVFAGFGAAALDGYVGALLLEDPTLRRAAVTAISRWSSDVPTAARHVLPLLGDTDAEVRQAAVQAFSSWGTTVMPLLQAVRIDGPGSARAGALEALAEIGGEAVISARDIAALERLARIELADDTPVPLSCCYLSWIAVPTGDQAGVMAILGLSQPRPVPFSVGVHAADIDSHGGLDADPLDAYRRVFVTPELAGWTLVVGAWCDPSATERQNAVLEACERLSTRYGRAQAYWWSATHDGSAVLIAEDGVVVRRFGYFPDEDVQHLELGAPLAYEQQRRAALELPPLAANRADTEEDADEWMWELLDLAPNLAGALGLNPLSVDASTSILGTGKLALTEYGHRLGTPPGALRR
ncbi:HEAT repeat domain-containing protein [Streptomyces sp. NPDC057460]|uniref:HEAT repeat domain-containing protein n=1 Tax=Streptomyces sp. NPDC057460 TaxID=3346141 RepID=UPI0036849886